MAGLLAGLALVIGCACVVNNYTDRVIDKKMKRTKNRALAAGKISTASALIYAVVLGTGGIVILFTFTNYLVVILALLALFLYIVPYGLVKRRSVHGTLVGTIPGALPPVIGYAAVTNRLDMAAFLLFLVLVFWQMPHFYAIAMYRYKDYKAAGLPVITVVKSMQTTKKLIIAYIFLYMTALIALFLFGYTGYVYLVGILITGCYWLMYGISKWHLKNDSWGREMFITSLKVTLVISILLALGSRLP